MDKKIKVHKCDYDIHKITNVRIIQLFDKEDNILLYVPIEMIAVNTFFRNFQEKYASEEPLSAPTHKMFLTIMNALNGKIQKVVIDDLQDSRFFATMYFTDGKGKEYSVQTEASDALALAILTSTYIYVKESIINVAKNNRAIRIYWYDSKDEESLMTLRTYSHEELVALPNNDVKQLLEIAAEIEDFDFAARLKKAMDEQLDMHAQIVEMINTAIAEDPEKFITDLKKSLEDNLRESTNDEN
jgi:bifunctional DNase/RNase